MGSSARTPPSLRPWQSSRTPETGAPQQRRDRHDTESWVEISSHPSSSSLSSIGDEIITTGLRVGTSSQQGPQQRRLAHNQRRLRHHRQGVTAAGSPLVPIGTPLASSSQDEYEETESEDEHFSTSSGEHVSVPTTPSRRIFHPGTESDNDENATTLGRRVPDSPPSFTPQPNAFSHPPAASTFPPNHPHSAIRGGLGGGLGGVRTLSHQRSGGPSFMASTRADSSGATSGGVGGYQPDSDAALRASLTTLLSCAAAARGISKDAKEGEVVFPMRAGGRISPGDQPMELRLVQESELLLAECPDSPAAPGPPSPGPMSLLPRGRHSQSGGKTDEKAKRRSATGSGVKPPRGAAAIKKNRMTMMLSSSSSEETLINPTLLTCVVSASLAVLVVVFGAGYVMGHEAGKQETISSVVAAGGLNASSSSSAVAAGCGSEVIRGSGGTLRKFRWGTDIARSVVAS